MPDFVYMLETRLTPEQQAAVRLVQQIARDHQMNAYLTGGSVRDLMTGFQIRDLDFSVQGNALKLQKDLEKAGSVTEGVQDELRVLFMLLPGRVRAEIASTRAEKFEKPSKPEIYPATMVEDLRRRDFTSNAMALSLNEGSYALLMDPFNGVADIENKHLRILHNYSFYEEPSRMLRAVRFISRFGWTMEERTQARYDTAKENTYIDSVSKAALGYELEQVVHEPDPLAAMRALEAEAYLKLLYPGWTPGKVDEVGLKRVAETRDKLASVGLNADASAANAEFLTKRMPEKDVLAMQKAMPRKGFVESWRKQEAEAKELAKRLASKEADTPSQTWRMLMTAKPETTLYLAVTTKQAAVERKLTDFFEVWPQFRQRMPYAIMTELRITPELPIYSKLLDEMFLLMIDGKLKAEEEVRAFLQPHSPPLPAPPPSFGRRGRGKKSAKAAAKSPAKAAAKTTAAAAATAPPAEAPKPAPVIEKVAVALGKAAATVQKAVTAVTSAAGASKATSPASRKTAPPLKTAPAQAAPAQAAPAKPAPAKPAKKTKPAPRAHKVNVTAKLQRKPAIKSKPAAKSKPVAKKKSVKKSAKPPAQPANKTSKKKTAKRR